MCLHWKAASIVDCHKCVVRPSPSPFGNRVVPIYSIFCKLDHLIGKVRECSQLTIFHLLEYLRLGLMPVGEGSNATLHLIEE